MKGKRKILYIAGVLSLGALIFVAYSAYNYYNIFLKANVQIKSTQKVYLYIPTNATFGQVLDSLRKNNYLINEQTFADAATHEQYSSSVKSGRYELKNGLSNKSLLRMLSLGNQAPVNLVIAGHIRSYEKLAAVLARNTEPDSLRFLVALYDTVSIAHCGFSQQTFLAMFIPNTYQVYWNVEPDALFKRLRKEYDKFWDDKRQAKSKAMSMTPVEVATLASIVNEETNKTDEMPRVAGVYINRIEQGIPLQADPTLRFSIGNFAIKRVLNIHKEADSPYNTYKHAGLPPGPICVPSVAAIDAVLNYEKHDYLYFCAKDDFSGYHAFAKTLAQHNQNAAKYQQALNKKRVFK